VDKFVDQLIVHIHPDLDVVRHLVIDRIVKIKKLVKFSYVGLPFWRRLFTCAFNWLVKRQFECGLIGRSFALWLNWRFRADRRELAPVLLFSEFYKFRDPGLLEGDFFFS
jgi:hypothetical protein